MFFFVFQIALISDVNFATSQIKVSIRKSIFTRLNTLSIILYTHDKR